MTDAELNKRVAEALGWTHVFEGLSRAYDPAGDYRVFPNYATDLNEAVKLPGFDLLERYLDGTYEARFVDRSGPIHRTDEATDDSPARAICLAFLAAYEAFLTALLARITQPARSESPDTPADPRTQSGT